MGKSRKISKKKVALTGKGTERPTSPTPVAKRTRAALKLIEQTKEWSFARPTSKCLNIEKQNHPSKVVIKKKINRIDSADSLPAGTKISSGTNIPNETQIEKHATICELMKPMPHILPLQGEFYVSREIYQALKNYPAASIQSKFSDASISFQSSEAIQSSIISLRVHNLNTSSFSLYVMDVDGTCNRLKIPKIVSESKSSYYTVHTTVGRTLGLCNKIAFETSSFFQKNNKDLTWRAPGLDSTIDLSKSLVSNHVASGKQIIINVHCSVDNVVCLNRTNSCLPLERYIPLDVSSGTKLISSTLESSENTDEATIENSTLPASNNVDVINNFPKTDVISLPIPKIPGFENTTFEPYVPIEINHKKVSLSEALRMFLDSLKKQPTQAPAPVTSGLLKNRTEGNNESNKRRTRSTVKSAARCTPLVRKRKQNHKTSDANASTSGFVNRCISKSWESLLKTSLYSAVFSQESHTTSLSSRSSKSSTTAIWSLNNSNDSPESFQNNISYRFDCSKVWNLKQDISHTYKLGDEYIPVNELFLLRSEEFLVSNVKISDIFC